MTTKGYTQIVKMAEAFLKSNRDEAIIKKRVLSSSSLDFSDNFNKITTRFGKILWEQIIGFQYGSLYTIIKESCNGLLEHQKALSKKENEQG